MFEYHHSCCPVRIDCGGRGRRPQASREAVTVRQGRGDSPQDLQVERMWGVRETGVKADPQVWGLSPQKVEKGG